LALDELCRVGCYKMTKQWERQPNETSVAYEAFTVYRDMGANRGLHAVSKTLQKSVTLLGRWSSQHKWVERATAYDDHIEALERGAVEKERIKLKRQRIKILTFYQSKLVEGMKDLDPSSASWKDITAGLQMIAREMRAEFGEDKAVVEVNNTVDVSANSTREELLERLKGLRNDGD